VNLQNHCRYLFHFDVPWNPGRMEQRNGRIDRTLQRSPEVFCHYFVLPQRPEDRVLDVLVKKTEEIRSTLGSLPPVVVGRLNELLARGINPTAIAATIEQIDGVDQDEGFKRTQALMSVELEDSRERTEELKAQISRLEKALQKSEDWLHFMQRAVPGRPQHQPAGECQEYGGDPTAAAQGSGRGGGGSGAGRVDLPQGGGVARGGTQLGRCARCPPPAASARPEAVGLAA
jgi:hypothetical protein